MVKLLFLLFVVVAEATLPKVIFGRPRGGFLQGADDDGYTWTDPSFMIYDTITQPNDHSGNNTGTWQQRFQYNHKYFNASRPLCFLMIGGEGDISPPGDKWVRNENVSMMNWAIEFGAAAFQLEHRFYGPKNYTPFGDQTTASLKYLTIHQALADIDNFITQMNKRYFSAFPNVKWITFGGSYPGTLSAFFREIYPSQTIGAVSSSSAVHFFTDYYGYAVNTEYTYRTVSSSCADNIGIGFKKMIDLAYGGPANRSQLVKKLNLCESFDDGTTPITKAVQYFFSNWYGLFQGINQYTGDNRDPARKSGLGVPGACTIMNNVSIGDEIDRIKAVNDWQNSFDGISPDTCNDNNYTKFIAQMSDTSYSNLAIVAGRSWIYQTCTCLGYFQTTDGNNGIFGSTVPLDFYADQCTAIFGADFTLENVFVQTDAYRKEYYNNYSGTKVVFPNGSFDPWKSLGMQLNDKNADVDSFLIDRGAHCSDMYPANATDSQSLKDARQRIHDHLANWIAQGFASTHTFSSPRTFSSPHSTYRPPQSSSILSLFPILFFSLLSHFL